MLNSEHLHKIADNLVDLVIEKNKMYGDSYKRSAEILRLIYPSGIPAERISDALLLVRILDKVFRVSNIDFNEVPDEDNPYLDLMGYSLLGLSMHNFGEE